MLKTLMRWIDSWSTPTAPETLTAENSKIQWQRILPFILLHFGLSSSILGWSVVVCSGLYAAVLPDSYVFHYGFFSSLFIA